MRLEDHFKETLSRAVSNEPPALDAWDRFERSLGRSRRWRFAVSLAGAAAVIVAAAIVVPQLGTGGVRPIPKVTQPPASIPTAGAPFPTDDWNLFRSDEGYELRYPRWWVTSKFEHQTEFRPYWLPGSAEGSPMIGVTFEVFVDAPPDVGPAPSPPVTTTRIQRTLAPDRILVGYLVASDPGLVERFAWITQMIFDSVRPYEGPGEEAPTPVRHMGTVASGVRSDALLETLVEFLDARLQGPGRGAEQYLTAGAKNQYENLDVDPGLYDGAPEGLVYVQYLVTSRDDADANSSEFVVEIVLARTDGTLYPGPVNPVRERIFVGPGTNHEGEQLSAVIRSVVPE